MWSLCAARIFGQSKVCGLVCGVVLRAVHLLAVVDQPSDRRVHP
ncbi:putative cross-wall-targeting lipoprotein signal domain-containing protein [Nocardia sp. NPDC051990]